MQYYLLKIESGEQDINIEEEIRELVYNYLLSKNILGECTIKDFTFLSFYCKNNNGVLRHVRQEEIVYIEKRDHKVALHTDSECFEFYSSLKQLQKDLDPELFVKVHQGYIVNLNKIKGLYSNELTLVSTDKVIPVSRRNLIHLSNVMKSE